MRVDYNKTSEIAKFNSNIEVKGSDTAASGDTGVKKNTLVKDTPYGVTATTVEKALFTLESELDKIKEDASQIDVSLIKKQMAVLSNTLSKEDAARLGQEGYSINGTPVKTIVTVMDKIKLQLARAGVDISIFGDDLSMEQLMAITGSAGQAVSMATDIKELSEGDIAYLVGNELEPTIENLYRAQHSGGSQGRESEYQIPEDEALSRQMAQVISQAGLLVNDTTMGYAKMLLSHEIPLTPENLAYVDQLHSLKLPPDVQEAQTAVSTAVSEGRKPQEAYLAEGYSLKDRALEAQQVIDQAGEEELAAVVESGNPVTIEALKQAQQSVRGGGEGADAARGQDNDSPGTVTQRQDSGDIAGARTEVYGQVTVEIEIELKLVTARRQLEEIRLSMSVEANYHLLKQGISIETMELSQLVEELKGIEDNYYRTLLEQAGIADAVDAAGLFRETMEKTEALKGFPVYAIGRYSITETSVEILYQSGNQLKVTMEQANVAYETMQTRPRQDLGDSMQKAFGNVDEILAGLDMEASPANRRAVRILAYNQLEISQESVTNMKAADEKLQNLFDNMKPAVVLEMIREGVHPLSMDVVSLNARAEEIAARLDPGQEEKYSKYLWELEQKHGITPEEKESYIGIYRLLRQIEKTDGAVIGAVVNQGGEISLKNLLSAVRSRRRTGMDVAVDDAFGAREAETESEDAIHRQIEAAYQTDCAKEAFHYLTQEGMQQTMEQDGWTEQTPEQLLWQWKQQGSAEVSGVQENEGARVQDEKRQENAYEQSRELFGRGSAAEEPVLRMLENYQLPVDTYHILAASQMMNHRNGIFRTLFDPENLEKTPDLEEVKEQILEKFAEAVKTPEDMAEAQQKLAEAAEHVMEGMINDEKISSRQVQDLKILRTQIKLSSRMSQEEHYAIPVLIADEMTNVQLKIVRGREKRGMVDVFFEHARLGKVASRIQVTESRTEVFVTAQQQDTLDQLKEREEELARQMQPEEGQHLRFDFVRQETVSSAVFDRQTGEAGQPEKESDAYKVQTRQLYQMARAFLETAKRLAG